MQAPFSYNYMMLNSIRRLDYWIHGWLDSWIHGWLDYWINGCLDSNIQVSNTLSCTNTQKVMVSNNPSIQQLREWWNSITWKELYLIIQVSEWIVIYWSCILKLFLYTNISFDDLETCFFTKIRINPTIHVSKRIGKPIMIVRWFLCI